MRPPASHPRVGIRGSRISLLEVAACTLGIAAVGWLSDRTDDNGFPLLLPSIAATAALLFIAPGLSISRAWNAIGGQTLSAAAGAICVLVFDGSAAWLAVAVAVGLALALMRLAHCLHPPGAATAVIMVVTAGGPFDVVTPVAVGTTLIVLWAGLVHLVERRWLAADVPVSGSLAEDAPSTVSR